MIKDPIKGKETQAIAHGQLSILEIETPLSHVPEVHITAPISQNIGLALIK